MIRPIQAVAKRKKELFEKKVTLYRVCIQIDAEPFSVDFDQVNFGRGDNRRTPDVGFVETDLSKYVPAFDVADSWLHQLVVFQLDSPGYPKLPGLDEKKGIPDLSLSNDCFVRRKLTPSPGNILRKSRVVDDLLQRANHAPHPPDGLKAVSDLVAN